LEGRVIIGSFQRDSLGSDLNVPKWQKGADILVRILSGLPRDKFGLLLCGPRRHYVIAQCKKLEIPYWYVGEETSDDDLDRNAIPPGMMPALYGLCDLYLITSRSESGPMAAQEAPLMGVFTASTDVGLARDFLDNRFVFRDPVELEAFVWRFVGDPPFRKACSQVAAATQRRVAALQALEFKDAALRRIYQTLAECTGMVMT
jgi:glycosyltransferase involved in cell wall biosynthesis